MTTSELITPQHLTRKAIIYIERVAEFMGLYFRGLRLSW
jgi:hypothetical protein